MNKDIKGRVARLQAKVREVASKAVTERETRRKQNELDIKKMERREIIERIAQADQELTEAIRGVEELSSLPLEDVDIETKLAIKVEMKTLQEEADRVGAELKILREKKIALDRELGGEPVPAQAGMINNKVKIDVAGGDAVAI